MAVVLTVLGALGLTPVYTSDYHQWQHLFLRLLKTLGRHLHFFAHFCAGQFLCNIQSSVGSCFLSTLGAVDGQLNQGSSCCAPSGSGHHSWLCVIVLAEHEDKHVGYSCLLIICF